jgi:hypothetical protein
MEPKKFELKNIKLRKTNKYKLVNVEIKKHTYKGKVK